MIVGLNLPATAASAAATSAGFLLASAFSLFAIYFFLSTAAIADDIVLTGAIFTRPTSSSAGSTRHIYIYELKNYLKVVLFFKLYNSY